MIINYDFGCYTCGGVPYYCKCVNPNKPLKDSADCDTLPPQIVERVMTFLSMPMTPERINKIKSEFPDCEVIVQLCDLALIGLQKKKEEEKVNFIYTPNVENLRTPFGGGM